MHNETKNIQQTANTNADRLNRHCYCITLDKAALTSSLRDQFLDAGIGFSTTTIPELDHFFSDTAVFVPGSDILTMEGVVQAIEKASKLSSYLTQVLSWAPDIAQFDPGPVGAFMGYDFHLGPEGPQLIEVNTNAGGAFLNAVLARAQSRCCQPPQHAPAISPALDRFDDAAFEMFKHEWQRQRGESMPQRLAIVDDAPESQFLFPEFQLAQRLLLDRGIETLVLDPAEFEYANGELTAGGERIDMVYNRLVDFALEAPHHAALRRAYLEGDYIAQDLVPPGERGLRIDDKVTTGGGFSPIFQV